MIGVDDDLAAGGGDETGGVLAVDVAAGAADIAEPLGLQPANTAAAIAITNPILMPRHCAAPAWDATLRRRKALGVEAGALLT